MKLTSLTILTAILCLWGNGSRACAAEVQAGSGDENAAGEAAAVVAYTPATTAEQAIARIEELGGSVRQVAQNDASLEIDFHLGGQELTDEHLQHLQHLPKVVSLHLKDTKITDQGLQHVGKVVTLRKLHLEKTAVTDAGLAHLAGLSNLEYLNVYGTVVTDAGLEKLKGLANLKRLYVWQTKVTEAGIEGLKQTISGLVVVPDPGKERDLARQSWERAAAAVAEANTALAKSKTEAGDLPAQTDALTSAADQARKKADELKKQLDAANQRAAELKKQFDEANRQAASLKTQVDQANQAATSAKQAADKASGARYKVEQAQKTLDELKKLAEETKERYQALGGKVD